MITLTLFGREVTLPCAAGEERWLRDLAGALETRGPARAEAFDALAEVALKVAAEAQESAAALGRARAEIDRLNEMLLAASPREAWRMQERASIQAWRAGAPLEAGRGRP